MEETREEVDCEGVASEVIKEEEEGGGKEVISLEEEKEENSSSNAGEEDVIISSLPDNMGREEGNERESGSRGGETEGREDMEIEVEDIIELLLSLLSI